jgi:hypothetical protein
VAVTVPMWPEGAAAGDGRRLLSRWRLDRGIGGFFLREGNRDFGGPEMASWKKQRRPGEEAAWTVGLRIFYVIVGPTYWSI